MKRPTSLPPPRHLAYLRWCPSRSPRVLRARHPSTGDYFIRRVTHDNYVLSTPGPHRATRHPTLALAQLRAETVVAVLESGTYW